MKPKDSMYYRNPIKIMCTTTVYLESIGFPLRHSLGYANRILYFDSMYTAVHLTIHRGIFICKRDSFWCFMRLWVFFRFVATTCVLSIQRGPHHPKGHSSIRDGEKYNLESQHVKMTSRKMYNLFVSFQRVRSSIFWSYVIPGRDYEI
jgi:hypothetical protein